MARNHESYMSAVAQQNSSFEQQKALVENAYSDLIKNMQSDYDAGAKNVNTAVDKTLQEAYVSKMKTERELPQSLAALGITGGLSESTAASIANNYGKSRAAAEQSRSDKINQLWQQFNAGKTNAMTNKSKELLGLSQSYQEILNKLYSTYANAPETQVIIEKVNNNNSDDNDNDNDYSGRTYVCPKHPSATGPHGLCPARYVTIK